MTSATRYFNLGTIAIFILGSVFTLVFISDLSIAQLIFYVYFILLVVYNCAFYGVDIRMRENWVKARVITTYVPVLVGFAFVTVVLGIFLADLDKMHETINNSYPVSKQDLRTSVTYTALVFLLLVLPPLFH